jgi:maltooligosyltrehalose synthase
MESNRSIDQRLGTNAGLSQLSQAIHDRGMALVLDSGERFVAENEVLELELLPNSGQVWVSSY